MKIDNQRHQGGFTYLMLLIALTVLALSILKSTDAEHMRHIERQEAELLFRGEQIRAAIAAYRGQESTEKSEKKKSVQSHSCFPVRFEQLLEDTRGSAPRYHLRQHFSDPLTQRADWGMIYDEKGRWIGVYSLGSGKPRRKVGFKHDAETFSQASRYADWAFSVQPDPQAPLPRLCE